MPPKKAAKKLEGTTASAAAKAQEAKGAPAAAPAKAEEAAPASTGDAQAQAAEPATAGSSEAPAAESAEAAVLVEHEVNAPAVKGKRIADKSCVFRVQDTTLNVMQTVSGKHLMALSDGGFQYLLAGARASVGLKAGRYVFEVLLTECKGSEGHWAGARPRCYARVGFATEEAPLLLGDGPLSVSFDTEGFFNHGRIRSKVAQLRMTQGQVAAVVLNLDASSANANTVSLFVDGVRVSAPQPLPDELKGKALFPAVTYRNMTLQAHFGPEPLRPLPFTCLTVGEAAVSDSVVLKEEKPKGGKHEVLVPVGLPDEGTFDWLDGFLAKNRNYVELSDRALLDWACKSGVSRPGGYFRRSCHDSPEFGFQLPEIDDLSLQQVVAAVAPLLPRNYVLMEVKNSLLESGRQSLLSRFPSSEYKKVARVVMGEPPADFRAMVQESILKDKTRKAEAEARRKRVENAKKKAAEEAKKKREAEMKARLEAVRKAREERDAAKAGDDKKDGDGAEKKDSDDKAEEEKAQEPQEEAAKEPEADGEADKMEVDEPEEEIKVELTADEKARRFMKRDIPDLLQKDMSANYMNFTVPKKEEGFDDVVYEWAKGAECQKYLESWIADRKVTQRVEDLQPSAWFREKYNEWQRELSQWKRRQQEYVDPAKRRAQAAAKRAAALARKLKEQKDAAAKAKNEAKDEAKDEADGEAKKEEVKEEATAEDGEAKAADAVEDEEEAKEEVKVNADELDVFAVEDINNIGGDEALYQRFQNEDWTLLSLRFEIHLLVHAYRHDLNDPSRPSFHESHLAHYYQLYYRKGLNPKLFGVETLSEVVAWIQDTVDILRSGVLEGQFSDDTPLHNFVRLTEDHRRERQRRVDMGDETAQLKFQRFAPAAGAKGTGQPGIVGKGHYSGKGGHAEGKGGYVGKGSGRPSYQSGGLRPNQPVGYSSQAAQQKRSFGAVGQSAAPAYGAKTRASYGLPQGQPPPPTGAPPAYGTVGASTGAGARPIGGYGLVPSSSRGGYGAPAAPSGYGTRPSSAYTTPAIGNRAQPRQPYGASPYARQQR